MERSHNMIVFMTLALAAAMMHGSSAQTTHVVGDGLGWTVPPGGSVAYRTWAASRTFVVGDVLVFNFTSGIHDVAEVSRASYGSCNATSPISISTNGPTRITLTSAGEHHFICTFARHCDFGQQLAINVSAASAAPAPQPATPPPAATPEAAPSPAVTRGPTPAPSPSSGVGRVYVVGDRLGWLVPGGPVAYQTWARGNRFMVGDTLVFNFTNGAHDVLEVTRAEFDSCNISTTTTPPSTAGPVRITLTSGGSHYYICTFPQHCTIGQKLAINVTGGSSTATPPSGSGGSLAPSSPTNSPPGSTGGGSTPFAPPPPNNSAASVAVAALPFTLLSVALAFFV